MKKLLVFIGTMFMCTFAIAQTISVDWKVDGNIYAQNTCEYGGTLTVPSTPPTKYGYTFLGWGNYQKLEYIESTGTQYLILPYIVNNETKFYCRYMQTNATNAPNVASAIFGVTDTPDPSIAYNGILRLLSGTANLNRVGWGDNTTNSIVNISAHNQLGTWYEIYYDQNKIYIDNILVATSATPITNVWQANYGLGIFARNGSSVTMHSLAKISSVWAKEEGVLVLNLVPAKRISDNAVGMYDTVTGTFFTNAGTGEFIAGPVVGDL